MIAGFQIHQQQKVPEKILLEKNTWALAEVMKYYQPKTKHDSNLPYICICLVVSTHLMSQHGNLPQSFGMNMKKHVFELPPGNIKSSSCIPPPKMGFHLIWPNWNNISPTFGRALKFSGIYPETSINYLFFGAQKLVFLVTINFDPIFHDPLEGVFFVSSPREKQQNFPSFEKSPRYHCGRVDPYTSMTCAGWYWWGVYDG